MSSEEVVFGRWIVSDIGTSNKLAGSSKWRVAFWPAWAKPHLYGPKPRELRYSPNIRGRGQDDDPANGEPCTLEPIFTEHEDTNEWRRRPSQVVAQALITPARYLVRFSQGSLVAILFYEKSRENQETKWLQETIIGDVENMYNMILFRSRSSEPEVEAKFQETVWV
ncbi:hypothetical protein K445DRAFT_366749 [Daldinia sp. EC12]|nr:hypothetical protein K445DRAFT_366749 [Daldinia sp. EC12]